MFVENEQVIKNDLLYDGYYKRRHETNKCATKRLILGLKIRNLAIFAPALFVCILTCVSTAHVPDHRKSAAGISRAASRHAEGGWDGICYKNADCKKSGQTCITVRNVKICANCKTDVIVKNSEDCKSNTFLIVVIVLSVLVFLLILAITFLVCFFYNRCLLYKFFHRSGRRRHGHGNHGGGRKGTHGPSVHGHGPQEHGEKAEHKAHNSPVESPQSSDTSADDLNSSRSHHDHDHHGHHKRRGTKAKKDDDEEHEEGKSKAKSKKKRKPKAGSKEKDHKPPKKEKEKKKKEDHKTPKEEKEKKEKEDHKDKPPKKEKEDHKPKADEPISEADEDREFEALAGF